MSGGAIKVDLSFNDGGTVFPGGTIAGGAGMQIYNPMGDNWQGQLLLNESFNLSPGGIFPIVGNSGTYNLNEAGMWVLIRNAGTTGSIAVQMSLSAAERSGADYEYVTIGHFKGATNDNPAPNEFMWIYLGGPNEVGGTARGLRVKATGSEIVNVSYCLISAGDNFLG
jgi:hypothetical protein